MEPPFRIRPAEARDAAAIVVLVRGLAEYEREDSRFREADFRRDALGRNPACRFWVAVEDDTALGFCMGYPGYDLATATRGMHLGDLFVAPGHRRGGVGRALVKALADETAAFGGEWMAWSVLRTNDQAVAFYQALGAVLQDNVARMAIGASGLAGLR